MTAPFYADAFRPHINTTFTAAADPASLQLVLVDVRHLGPAGSDGKSFALDFVAPRDAPILPQAIHPLTHDAMEPLEIFLVPNGPVAGGKFGYEAIFT